MDYQILVLDLDGTLTNSKKEITQPTLEALIEIQEAGKKVVLASGRPTQGVMPLAEQLHLTHRVVPGDSRYLETLLAGPWDAGRFICIPENTVITDADVLLPPAAGRK